MSQPPCIIPGSVISGLHSALVGGVYCWSLLSLSGSCYQITSMLLITFGDDFCQTPQVGIEDTSFCNVLRPVSTVYAARNAPQYPC